MPLERFAKNAFWLFWGWITAKLASIWSKIHQLSCTRQLALHATSIAFWDILARARPEINFSFFSFSFLFAAVIDLLLGLLAVKNTSKEASSRRAIFTIEQPGVVAGNFSLSFSLNFLRIFVQISGSIRPIILIWTSLERYFPSAEVEYRWCQVWSKVMTSEVDERPTLVTGSYGRHRNQWVNNLFLLLKECLKKKHLERLIQGTIYCNSHTYVTLDRRLNYSAQRTRVSKPRRIHRWNHEYRLVIQILHGSRKTFRSRVTNDNFLSSRFTENLTANHASREHPYMTPLVVVQHSTQLKILPEWVPNQSSVKALSVSVNILPIWTFSPVRKPWIDILFLSENHTKEVPNLIFCRSSLRLDAC